MIVGVDISSRRIDLAWLDDGKPCRWHQDLAKGHLIDRLRSIRVEWPGISWDGIPGKASKVDVTDVAIEMPFGQSRSSVGALMAVVGVVTKQAPTWARVAWPSSGELRAAIGAKNTKQDAHAAIWELLATWDPKGRWRENPELDKWSEHSLDALVACIGWTRILEQQDTP